LRTPTPKAPSTPPPDNARIVSLPAAACLETAELSSLIKSTAGTAGGRVRGGPSGVKPFCVDLQWHGPSDTMRSAG